ncbi:MAG: autotransporter domain-containing protein, partial [Alphaproteobacteria bacterium]|nr:autotransporter domain-containing protein [Alphaproteobacteria bacterium]
GSTGGAITNTNVLDITGGNYKSNSSYFGGAIFTSAGNVSVDSASFESNHATVGGAIYTYNNLNGTSVVLDNINVQSNTADVFGGGVYASLANLTINGGTIGGDSESKGNVAQYGGGINNKNYNTGFAAYSILNVNDTAIKNNKATKNGGGINNEGTLTVSGAKFVSNSADVNGGGLYAYNESVATVSGTSFNQNTAGANGGAVYNKGEMTLNNRSSFTNNTATKGGAIYNEGTVTISDSAFTHNTATGSGGAIVGHDTSAELTLNNVTFTDNSADWAGALLARGTTTITGGSFVDNHSNDGGGAIYLATLGNKGHTLEVDGTTFTNNYTIGVDVDGGGALGSFSGLTVRNATFTGNYMGVDGVDTVADGGGAIFMGSESNNVIEDTTFTNNTSKTWGGAISMRDTNKGNNATATLDMVRTTFTGNSADKGGAIYNTFHNDELGRDYAYLNNNTFVTNNAANGGAIYNASAGTTDTVGGVIWLDNSTFTNNTATTNGGAIYNANVMTIGGTNTFSGNKANGVANDIYNTGTLTFAAGSATEMDGGIVGTGSTTLASGATLNLATASLVQDSFELSGIVNAELRNANEFAKFTVGTFSGTGDLNLALKGVGEYKVFADSVFTTGNVNVTDSPVFTYNWNDAGNTIIVSTKSANEIIDALDVDVVSANAVVNLATNTHDETAQQIGNALATALANGDTELVEHEVKKLAPEEKPVTHSVASSVQNQVLTLTANRMSGGMVGRAGGDEIDADYGFWAQGLYNKSRYLGEFDGQSRGVAVGFDALINKIYTLGIGYAFSNADVDVKGDGGKMDIDSHTVFVYGQYKPSNWFINATLSNTVSNYTEKAVVMLTPVETEYDVNSFGVQAMTGYDFASGVTPMVGMRYLHVSTDGHQRLLGYVDDSQSSYLSAVGGLKYAFDIQDTGDIRWTPELRALATYDVISDKNGATVYVPGGSIYHVAGDRMSRAGGEFGLGLTAEWRGLELSVNYDLQLRKDYMSHTGMIKLRYEF